MPVGSSQFLKVTTSGLTTSVGPTSGGYYSAAWSTNGYAYGVQTEGLASKVAIIDRMGGVTEVSATADVFPSSHYGFVAREDGTIIGCPYSSSHVLVLSPHTRRTVSNRIMTSPWLNKW
jgi:hypothetical protein